MKGGDLEGNECGFRIKFGGRVEKEPEGQGKFQCLWHLETCQRTGIREAPRINGRDLIRNSQQWGYGT